MRIPDWSRFSQKIYLDVPLPQVYDAWTTRRNIEAWFLRKGEFRREGRALRPDERVQAGDTYEWLWHGHPDTTVEHGTVTEANGTDRFAFVFGKAGVVTVTMKAMDERVTEMIITQDQIPTDEQSRFDYHVGCSTGWTFYNANIKSVLEGGMDLRNKNMAYSNVINS